MCKDHDEQAEHSCRQSSSNICYVRINIPVTIDVHQIILSICRKMQLYLYEISSFKTLVSYVFDMKLLLFFKVTRITHFNLKCYA